MDDFAGIFTLFIFLFYAVIAAAFVVGAIRQWVWPFLKERLPLGQSLPHDQHVHSADREHSTSHP